MSGRTWAAVIVALVIAGFGGYQVGLRNARPGAAASSTTPSAVSTPTNTVSAFPAVSPVHNPVVDSLHCRLPVYLLGQTGSGGFISLPDGAVTSDRSSNVSASLRPAGGSEVAGVWYGLTFDGLVHQWLPVPRSWVSPDGVIYLVGSDPSRNLYGIYEVNAQTGTSAQIYNDAGGQVIGVGSDRFYAIPPSLQNLWVLKLNGPRAESSVGDYYFTAASGFYAYGSLMLDGGAIARVDTRDSTKPVAWFNKSSSANVIGFDGTGDPVIWTGTDLWIASAPDQATRITSKPPLPAPTGSGGAPIYGANAPVPDSHGLWLSTTDGIYLYVGGQITKVSNLVAQVAGTCA